MTARYLKTLMTGLALAAGTAFLGAASAEAADKEIVVVGRIMIPGLFELYGYVWRWNGSLIFPALHFANRSGVDGAKH